jgi:peptide/nickel transport system permease protein
MIHAAGDPVDGFLAPGTSPEVREAARQRLGLNDSIGVQYARYLGNTLSGDFGDSWRNRMPAAEAVLQRLPATLRLASVAIVVSSVGGVLIGVASVWTGNVVLRRGVQLVGMLGQAVPAFWLGTLVILLFAVRLQWLPSSGSAGWQSLVLPAITLAAYPGSMIARVTQSSLLDVQRQPYLTTARAKGLPARLIWFRHALPNALLPTLALIGLQASFLVGGTIVVESVFAYPGVGRLAMQAATERDLPVVQAFVVITILLVAAVNVAVDLLAGWIDPVLRQGSGALVNG